MIFLLDFETTGLVKNSRDFMAQPGIVQVGVVVLHGAENELLKYREETFYSTLVNPEIGVWEEGAIKTHGITPDKVRDAPTFFQVFEHLVKLASGCNTWGGYNTTFDKDVLWYQLLRYGFERSFPWPRHDLDVMKIATDHFGEQGKKGLRNLKQTDVYERLFSRHLAGAHDALADIRATADILRELSK